MKRILSGVMSLTMIVSMANAGAQAATRKQELISRETYSQKDALRARVYVKAAMDRPMGDLLRQADFQHPEVMLEYGLGLYLGRPSESGGLSDGEKACVKTAYRDVLDLYLTSSDRFPGVTFDEDAMLDNGDFWVYLAEHVGDRKDAQRLSQSLENTGVSTADQSALFSMSDNQNQSGENIGDNAVLDRHVVNAGITCATSAMGFARMKKAQTVDIAETKLSPDKYQEMRKTAARLYTSAYGLGTVACGDRDTFLGVSAFAANYLGSLGAMRDDPSAMPVTLSAPKSGE